MSILANISLIKIANHHVLPSPMPEVVVTAESPPRAAVNTQLFESVHILGNYNLLLHNLGQSNSKKSFPVHTGKKYH